MIRKEMDVHKQGVITWTEWLAWWQVRVLPKIMDFVLKDDGFCTENDEFHTKNDEFGRGIAQDGICSSRRRKIWTLRKSRSQVRRNDEFHITMNLH